MYLNPVQFLERMIYENGITKAELAKETNISPMRITHLLKGSRPITPEIALRFAKAFGNKPEDWLHIQVIYDLQKAKIKWEAEILKIKRLN